MNINLLAWGSTAAELERNASRVDHPSEYEKQLLNGSRPYVSKVV